MQGVMAKVRSRDGVVLGGGLIAVGATVAALGQIADISSTTVGLVLILVVLVTATLGRLWTAIVVALTATAALNFFFLPPVGAFTIAHPQNWVAVIVFLVVAVIASELSSVAQRRAREAIARRNEVTRLFDLTRDVLLTTETAGAIEVLTRHIARRFELRKVAICLPVEDGWAIHQGGEDTVHLDVGALNTALAKARGTLEFDARRRAYGGHSLAGEHGDVTIVPLRHGTKAVGLLAAASSALDIGTLDAVAGVVAIAIERVQFLGERDAAALVRQKAELAGTLLASLSHDLRTPLTAIRVAVENLKGELPTSARHSQSEAAVAEIDRLTRLFQDILDMARIDADAISVERQWVTAADVVDAALAHVRHFIGGHRLRVEADGDREVQIDPRLTSIALSHVLENAAHYSPVAKEIVVNGRIEPDGLHLSITDQGSGLDPGELDHLFERFYRGRSARQATFGTGMGLSITRGLLNAAGGRVWAENVHGGGARFTLVVPGPVRVAAVVS